MQIVSITVSSQRKLPHPDIDYANVSGFISMTAELIDKDNVDACIAQLQTQADAAVEKHVERVCKRLTSRAPMDVSKPAAATATKAAELAAKHGAKQ